MDVELRHLRTFLALASAGSFTRAAERLAVSQSSVSRTLAQLERRLGVTLVQRTSRRLDLTEAGVRFRDAADEAVRAVDHAIHEATATSRPLRLAYAWSTGDLAAQLRRAWQDRHGPAGLELVRLEGAAAMADGEVDAALMWGEPSTTAGVRRMLLEEHPRAVALPADHPLAARRTLRLSQLARLGLIVNSRGGTTTPELWPEGERPEVVEDVATTDDWLVAIAAGVGFGVTAATTAHLHPHPGVRFVPLVDAPPLGLVLAWPQPAGHPRIPALLAVADGVRPAA